MLLVATDPHFEEHDAGRSHPERPARVRAVLEGLDAGAPPEARRRLEPRRATRAELERVHTARYLDHLERFCAAGGGHLDADTGASAASWEAALLAAGSGLEAVDALERGEGDSAFCAVRPPGPPCRGRPGDGLLPAEQRRGDRGRACGPGANACSSSTGTRITATAPRTSSTPTPRSCTSRCTSGRCIRVPGGSPTPVPGAGAGTTVNFPLPAGATGDVYLDAIDHAVEPLVEEFAPTWVLISAGFDAHRADPLTGLGLSAGDYVDLTARVMALAAARRLVVFLEGGYDLDALRDSTAATVSTLIGSPQRVEPATGGGPGRTVVQAVADLHGSPDAPIRSPD